LWKPKNAGGAFGYEMPQATFLFTLKAAFPTAFGAGAP
jgi:hypothetical protein